MASIDTLISDLHNRLLIILRHRNLTEAEKVEGLEKYYIKLGSAQTATKQELDNLCK